MPESHKTCTKCGEDKPLSEFYPHRTTRDRHTPDCKACRRADTRRRKAARRGPPREPSQTYEAVHLHLLAHYPKTGMCEECGAKRRTDYALIHGRPYTRDRENYRELCHPCHSQYDHGGERCYAAKLTEVQVAEIRLRYSQGGVMQKTLATEYGVSDSQIYNIVHGLKWAASL